MIFDNEEKENDWKEIENSSPIVDSHFLPLMEKSTEEKVAWREKQIEFFLIKKALLRGSLKTTKT